MPRLARPNTAHGLSSHAITMKPDGGASNTRIDTFLREGAGQGESVIVLARTATNQAIKETIGQTAIRFYDGESIVDEIAPAGVPDEGRFQACMGTILAGSKHLPGRAYGELVDILAQRGYPEGALALERMWNRLPLAAPMQLLCGYAVGGLARHCDEETLSAICSEHPEPREYPEPREHPEHPAEAARAHLASRPGKGSADPLRPESMEGLRDAYLRHRVRLLQEANDGLEAFAASITHDLRNEIATVTGLVELLSSHRQDMPASARRIVAHLETRARHLGGILDPLRQLAVARGAELHLKRVDLAELARDCVAARMAVAKHGSIRVHIEPSLHTMGDPDLLRIVLENLIGNAFKFTRARTEAAIAIGHDGTSFFIKDNGVGFDPDDAARIFEPFQRLHAERFDGDGLGLATVATILGRHHGWIKAEGRRGEGATFRFATGPGSAGGLL